MAQAEDPDQIESKHKAIFTLFPYAVQQEQSGDNRMVDALLAIIKVPSSRIFMFMAQPIAMLLGKADPNFPNRLMTLMSPYADWELVSNTDTVTQWAAAASAVPYTEEVCQSVVDTLLHIASVAKLQPHIPTNIWAWLKKQPSLPPVCYGRWEGAQCGVVRRVRELGDVEILEAYFLLVWSEWNVIYPDGLTEMCTSIREDLCGIGMGRHREVLVGRLDHVLGQLDSGSGHLRQHNPILNEYHIQTARGDYRELKEVLLEMDREALEILTSTPLRLTNLFGLLTTADTHRIPLDVRLCAPSSVSVVARSRHSPLIPPTCRACPSLLCTVNRSSMLSGRVSQTNSFGQYKALQVL